MQAQHVKTVRIARLVKTLAGLLTLLFFSRLNYPKISSKTGFTFYGIQFKNAYLVNLAAWKMIFILLSIYEIHDCKFIASIKSYIFPRHKILLRNNSPPHFSFTKHLSLIKLLEILKLLYEKDYKFIFILHFTFLRNSIRTNSITVKIKLHEQSLYI